MVEQTHKPLTYKDAGVDIDAVTHALRSVGEMARSTHTERVLGGVGSFGALFRADFAGYEEPVLVSSTDGVGTKLLVARRAGRFDTVGADLVNHCVDDILVMGAEPLFFLDYVAADRFPPGRLEAIVSGFAKACRENGLALVGGETAEMPGLYRPGDFDLAGFIVGVVDRRHVLGSERVRGDEVLVALPSTGLHTNGYSLAQKILFERSGLQPDDELPEVGTSVADALLAVHRSYLHPVRGLLRHQGLHALVHVTGGGFTDNVPRVLPEGVGAVIDRDSWTPPPLFVSLARRGPVTRDEMDRTFNMGLGLLLAVDPAHVDAVERHLREAGEQPVRCGKLERGPRKVRYTGSDRL